MDASPPATPTGAFVLFRFRAVALAVACGAGALAPSAARTEPAPPAPTTGPHATSVVMLVMGPDAPDARAAAGDLYRALAGDARFRPEFHAEMRAALEDAPPSDPHATEAQRSLDAARAALARLAYGEAVTLAEAAIGEAQRAAPSAATTRLVADALIMQAVSEHLRGAGEPADRAFRFALALDPKRTLDPIVYRADIRERLERVRRTPRAQGRLLVRSSPEGATVSLDGRAVGVTPAEGPGLPIENVPGGEHLVAVAKPGFFPNVRRRTVNEGGTTEVDAILARADKPTHTRELVAGLRAAYQEARADDEGRFRLALAHLLEVEAIVVIMSAEGHAPDPDRTAAVAVYDGATAAPLGDVVLEMGRRSRQELADAIARLLPKPRAARRPVMALVPPNPQAPPSPPPLYRRFWFVGALSGLLVTGTVVSAVWLSKTQYRGVVEPYQ